MEQNKHYSKNNSILKQGICIFASFLLAVSITVLALFTSVKLGFVNEKQVLKAFESSNFYSRVYTELMSDCENEAIISGLSKEIFDGVFSLEELTNYVNTYVLSYLHDEDYTLDTSAMEQRLSENIHTYATENNLVVDGDIDAVISSFTSTVVAYYKTAGEFPYFDQITSIFHLFDKLIIYIMPCMSVFCIVLVILLWRLNTFKKNRTFRYLSYGFLSSAISILVIPIACFASGFYKRILITPEYVYRYLISYLTNGLQIFIYVGIGLFIFGAIFIFVSFQIKQKLKKKSASSHSHHHLD